MHYTSRYIKINDTFEYICWDCLVLDLIRSLQVGYIIRLNDTLGIIDILTEVVEVTNH